MNLRDLKPVAVKLLPYVIGALGMVGVQNTVPGVKQATIGASLTRADIESIVEKLPAPVTNVTVAAPKVNVAAPNISVTIPPARVTLQQRLVDMVPSESNK